ncbi:hypothetical protein AMECASPLE_022977 [Ameca splendens]|uniref:Uncharacterized protein n=1 Tax=Ameca splendens TaxID=208324 RepID=A0ABV0ZNU4_9TELE
MEEGSWVPARHILEKFLIRVSSFTGSILTNLVVHLKLDLEEGTQFRLSLSPRLMLPSFIVLFSSHYLN